MRSSTSACLIGLVAAAAAILGPAPAQAFSPFLVTPEPAVAEASAAYRYANMSDASAMAEIERRQILHTVVPAASAPGVRAPIRLTGRLHGVWFHSSLPPEERVVSMFEILDARLALALDDFAALLERHDIDEVVHFTMYRPNVGAPSHGGDDAMPAKAAPSFGAKGAIDRAKASPAPLGPKQKAPEAARKPEIVVTQAAKKPAAKAPHRVAMKAPPATRRPIASAPKPPAVLPKPFGSALHQTTWAAPGTRHPAGLAIDVGAVHKRDGRWINVGASFHGKIGAKTCGEGALPAEDPDARELRSLVCESSYLGLFTYVLTPNYNGAHADHFHMEIKPEVRWFLYH